MEREDGRRGRFFFWSVVVLVVGCRRVLPHALYPIPNYSFLVRDLQGTLLPPFRSPTDSDPVQIIRNVGSIEYLGTYHQPSNETTSLPMCVAASRRTRANRYVHILRMQ